jgi:peptidoglycan/xylan/chitin deacetylase (PgdA/CDA1 family)
MVLLMFLFFTGFSSLTGSSRRPVQIEVALLDAHAASGGKPGAVEFQALRRIFDIQGIPYRVLTDTANLRRFRFVIAGGALTNVGLSAEKANALYDYVELGGTLFAAGEIGNRVFQLFGVRQHAPSRRRYRLYLAGDDESFLYLDRPNERTISLGNGERHFYDEVIWSHGYLPAEGCIPLGTFEDGSMGFARNQYGRGTAYLLGLSFSESVMLPQVGDDFEAQRRFVNSFEPSADVIMLILKALYESRYEPFLYLCTAPYARTTALILSHDVDAQTAFVDSLKFAALENRFGAKSTFFINTKYFSDWMDIDYYNVEANREAIEELHRLGYEIGSHTVSHYKKFSSVDEGNASVTFDSYDPEKRITVQGEVRVSKELLDRDVRGQDTVSFRAGDLEFPHMLIRVLEESGYLYDSTHSANDVLTAFPYMAMHEGHLGSTESHIVELPVTLDDSLDFLTAETVDEVVRVWLDVALAHMDNEAITVLLVHPSDTRDEEYKLGAQERLMRGIESAGGWMGDVRTYGRFWRDRLELDYRVFREGDGSLVIEVDAAPSTLNPAIGFVLGNVRSDSVLVTGTGGTPLGYTVDRRNGKLFLGKNEK